MAITSWPYTDQDTTDVEYSRLFREMAGDGVVGSLSSSGSGALRPYGDSSGMQIKMTSGSAIARGYMMLSTATETIAVGSSHATLRRTDRLVLELNLSNPTSATRLTPKIVAGTPSSSSSPAPAALTQTDTGVYQIGIALITVDPGVSTIASSKVKDDRPWLDQMVGQWIDEGKRPSSPRKYKLGFNENLGYYEYWNGSSWVSLNDHEVALNSNFVTGTLPISKGGTGATTKSGIRAAIGLYVQSSAPSSPATDDLWVKKS